MTSFYDKRLSHIFINLVTRLLNVRNVITRLGKVSVVVVLEVDKVLVHGNCRDVQTLILLLVAVVVVVVVIVVHMVELLKFFIDLQV